MNFRNRDWDIVKLLPVVGRISLAIIIVGWGVGLWLNHPSPLRLGLTFTGGTVLNVRFDRSVTVTELRAALKSVPVVQPDGKTAPVDLSGSEVTLATKPGDPIPNDRAVIQTQQALGSDPGAVFQALDKVAPVDRKDSAVSSVGPALSREYLFKAVEALIIAIGIQFIYIAFRFGWNYIFGVVTVVALLRDAAMMVGVYALFNQRADDAFLAALLTVVGYSVMDTIVIFDRIRENTKLMVGETYRKIVNVSILQTMTRSINTLATVVVTLVALLAFGGATLKGFAFALLVGICSGGYHSIFFSAPLVEALRERQLKKAQAERTAARAAGETAKPKSALDEHERDDLAVTQARRERRQREKAERQKATASTRGARYRRKRAPLAQNQPEEEEAAEEFVDPLDAQRAGAHEAEMELGHEPINLRLDDEPAAGSEPAQRGEG
ncbi:MAG TPA: protein translocase subunit SecF [Candidatus Dormibacteraeota bacterium]|nr:protein translocase subunit SecF [Candidatus Dormibacteraeota bacterium]